MSALNLNSKNSCNGWNASGCGSTASGKVCITKTGDKTFIIEGDFNSATNHKGKGKVSVLFGFEPEINALALAMAVHYTVHFADAAGSIISLLKNDGIKFPEGFDTTYELGKYTGRIYRCQHNSSSELYKRVKCID